jgi:hypothetical protein
MAHFFGHLGDGMLGGRRSKVLRDDLGGEMVARSQRRAREFTRGRVARSFLSA